MSRTAALLLALVVLATTSEAQAVKYRRPFNSGVGLGHGRDNDSGGGGCTDWGCGGVCYNGHSGSDFPIAMGTDVLAGAPGKVTAVVQGCADWGGLGNSCGGYCGNHVEVKHDDGSRTLYCHMKNGAMKVSKNQKVTCGQKLGKSASSGSSTGPHLHFGWKPPGATTWKDPFKGGCSSNGAWVDQGAYPGKPSTKCQVVCQCTVGKKESKACGKCGTKTRTCLGNCTWGGWSSCGDQGTCSAGDTQTEDCCDCGSRARTCKSNCEWGSWSDCAGPDPGGAPACDTGQPGVCAAGVVRCLDGCLGCAETVTPSDELCDGLDNDCDGPTDEGATELGAEVPAYAAALEDLSAPGTLVPGEEAWVWARFRNVGTQPWPPGVSWLRAEGPDAGISGLWVAEGWSAWDAASAADAPTEVGEVVTLAFPIQAKPGAVTASTFTLHVEGQDVACPAPGFELEPALLAVPEPETPEPDTWTAPPAPDVAAAGPEPTVGPPTERAASLGEGEASVATAPASSGCGTSPTHAIPPVVLGLLLVALSARSRPRARPAGSRGRGGPPRTRP